MERDTEPFWAQYSAVEIDERVASAVSADAEAREPNREPRLDTAPAARRARRDIGESGRSTGAAHLPARDGGVTRICPSSGDLSTSRGNQ
jgi:hypothetical protein